MGLITRGINGQASKNTLITLPTKVAGEGLIPLSKGLRNRISSITIGNSIRITSIDCFQLLGDSLVVASDGNHPEKELGRR